MSEEFEEFDEFDLGEFCLNTTYTCECVGGDIVCSTGDDALDGMCSDIWEDLERDNYDCEEWYDEEDDDWYDYDVR